LAQYLKREWTEKSSRPSPLDQWHRETVKPTVENEVEEKAVAVEL
jgi:hypothetical protein